MVNEVEYQGINKEDVSEIKATLEIGRTYKALILGSSTTASSSAERPAAHQHSKRIDGNPLSQERGVEVGDEGEEAEQGE